MSTFGYGRVSTLDHDVQNQRGEIERTYQIDYWFEDRGVSGAIPAGERPQFAEMIAKIRDGETLVVSKLDRLGRDAQDVGATIKFLTARKIKIIVLQLGQLDLTSAPGKLMLAMLAAVAEMERDLLVERTQAGLARAKAQGKTLGRPSKTSPAQRIEIRARYADGQSVSGLARLYGISRATVLAVIHRAKSHDTISPPLPGVISSG